MFHKSSEVSDSVVYLGREIKYHIKFSKRKNISIVVKQDKSVRVSAPNRVSAKYIKGLIEKRAEWIISKQAKFSNFFPQRARKYENGESYYFLGKKYYLQVIFDLVNKVEINGENLVVRVIKFKQQKVKKLVEEWFEKTSQNIFLERLEICKVLVSDLGINYNGNLKFRKMKSRWGSCSRSGDITLSYELIKTPIECVDYVIAHELCHLREFNHSKSFYELLDRIMPDWKSRKNALRNIREDYYE